VPAKDAEVHRPAGGPRLRRLSIRGPARSGEQATARAA
jgi:hypothetical protein